MKRQKVWLSVSMFDTEYFGLLENLNPNSIQYHIVFNQAMFVQISKIKECLERLLVIYPSIEQEGFYISSGATYYIALWVSKDLIDSHDFSMGFMKRLSNRPKTNFHEVSLNETYLSCKEKCEKEQ